MLLCWYPLCLVLLLLVAVASGWLSGGGQVRVANARRAQRACERGYVGVSWSLGQKVDG